MGINPQEVIGEVEVLDALLEAVRDVLDGEDDSGRADRPIDVIRAAGLLELVSASLTRLRVLFGDLSPAVELPTEPCLYEARAEVERRFVSDRLLVGNLWPQRASRTSDNVLR